MRQALWMAMVGGVMLAAACTAEAAGEGQPTDSAVLRVSLRGLPTFQRRN